MKARLSTVCGFCLASGWWLVVTSYIFDPFKNTYEELADADLDSVPPFWNVILSWVSFRGAMAFVPFLILHPHSQNLNRKQNWLLHSIGIVTLVLGLYPLFISSWTKETVLALLDAEGIISGRAAVVYLGMLLLAISRRSSILDFHGFGYLDLIAFHKAAGWWCVAMTSIHSVAYSVYYLIEGGLRAFWRSCFPTDQCSRTYEACLNTLGLVNFFGALGFVAVIILAVFSRERIRRSMYEHFYFIHLAAAGLFVLFSALHDFLTMLLAFAGLVFYFCDRWTARRSRTCCSEVTAEVLCRSPPSSIVHLTWKAAARYDLMPGSRWIYLGIENITKVQWHPVSVIQLGDHIHVLVKGLGDWSCSLCGLVASEAMLRIKTEGPFGKPVCKPSARSRTLLLIAGGVGISPFADLLCNMPQDGRWHKVTLIWTARHQEYEGLSSVLDLESLSWRAEISVFVTSTVSEVELAPFRMGRKIIAVLDREHVPKFSKIHKYGFMFLSCMWIAAFVFISYQFQHLILKSFRYGVSTLAGYTFVLRVLPVLLSALLIVLAGLSLQTLEAISQMNLQVREHNERTLQTQLANAEALGPRAPRVHFHRPNLQHEIEREAKVGPVHVQVCGPERMSSSVAKAVYALGMQAHDINLDIHESAI